jgi:hypothetical protein
MIDRATLKSLGWTDELVGAAEEAADQIARPLQLQANAAFLDPWSIVSSDKLDIGDAPPVAATRLTIR